MPNRGQWQTWRPKSTLDHDVQHRFQTAFDQKAPAPGLRQAPGDLQSQTGSEDALGLSNSGLSLFLAGGYRGEYNSLVL